MNYPSIRIGGAILSPDIMEQIDDISGQRPADFGLDSGTKVKDEIARAWADAQDYWRIFQRKLETVRDGSNATTETRNIWMVPLLSLLRYDLEYQPRGAELNGQIYAISHRAINRDGMAVQVVGYNDPAGLDRKPANATRRMSAHALVQEYLNLHDQLYGLVTDGHVLRLLRDSSRLVKQSYLEFDLDRIFTDGLFADFAILFRLLHSSRMPASSENGAECWIERYHQDSLESGARIRAGLSKAVEEAIVAFGTGFLRHPSNDALRTAVDRGELSATEYYQQLLRLIYRLLFLMVIEERDLVFPPDTPRNLRDIHRDYYSVARLRRMSEKTYLADPRCHDLWLALQASFRLFEANGPGEKLGIAPLAGDLFSPVAMRSLADCELGNDVLLGSLRALSLYRHPDSGQLIRVNYAALNVEEFGSVYEGLLEYEPEFAGEGRDMQFTFRQGDERAATGSHYTPDELVQPLIRHSLDHLIADRLKAPDPAAALLDLRVADVACGSGHILLAAARRIATELAIVRTGEEQPSPSAFRTALRDVIRNCIYGVDLNPLAVELCKVALWLEAHVPGQPLNFFDHHIKCGNAIVGFARAEELAQGVPTEAFRTLHGDDKELAAVYRKKNKEELKHQKQTSIDFTDDMSGHFDLVLSEWRRLSELPETTPAEIDAKKSMFAEFAEGEDVELLRTIADIPIAQFYIPKVLGNENKFITDAEFRGYWRGQSVPSGKGAAEANSLGKRKRQFHWFLEFPEVMNRGGFDCILGNPPYLGGQALSGTYGHAFCECMRWMYAPTGLSELVTYFLRRIHGLLRDGGFTAIITTNSIVDGDVRKDGLEQLIAAGSEINMAVRGMKWPGAANLVVSLVALHNGPWKGLKVLDGASVSAINTYFEDSLELGEPWCLATNSNRLFQGSTIVGDGFYLTDQEAADLLHRDPQNSDVIFWILNTSGLNTVPDQKPQRQIINFHDWPKSTAMKYEEPFHRVEFMVKPVRETDSVPSRREKWWQFGALAKGLYSRLSCRPFCFASARTTKYLSFSQIPTDILFTDCNVFAVDRWDLYTVVQSTLHEVWARKYSGSLKQDLRYSPSKCFDTFSFPADIWCNTDPGLATIGEHYHVHRKSIMQSLWLGLTKIYNLFHARTLSPQMVAKAAKSESLDGDAYVDNYNAVLELRRLHVKMDLAVRDAYGWHDLDLEHDFHEVEYLPEKDRVRYTISPAARREVLKRLLIENHARAAAEAAEKAAEAEKKASKPRKKRGKAKKSDDSQSVLPFEVVPTSMVPNEQQRRTAPSPKRAAKKPAMQTPMLLDDASVGETVKFAEMGDSLYPSAESDRAICAAALCLIEHTGPMNSVDHLDALLLATHPKWMKTFLDDSDHDALQKASATAPTALSAQGSESIKWKKCRDYLEKRGGLIVQRETTAQPIQAGESFDSIRTEFSANVDALVVLALKALDRFGACRQDLGVATPAQQQLVTVIERQHASYQLTD